MKILIISQYFYPEEFKVNDLAKTLVQKGHEVHVLTGQPNYPSGKITDGYGYNKVKTEDWEGVRIIRTPIFPRRDGRKLPLILNYLSFIFYGTFWGLPRLNGPYDVSFVFATSPITSCFPAIFYKWFSKTPIVLWVQDLWPETLEGLGVVKNKLFLKIIGYMVRLIYKNCDKILIQSEAFRPNVKKWDGDESKVTFVPNWAEELYEKRPSTSSTEIKKPGEFAVVFAGNHGDSQALDTSVSAAELLRDQNHIKWVFVGDGREKQNFLSLIKEKNLEESFRIIGRRTVEEMPGILMQADALLVTLQKSPVFTMVVPSKIQSYMASQKPIVAAIDGEGARTILESRSGYVGPAEDAKELSQNVKKLSQNTEKELRAMGESGFQFYENHFKKSQVVNEIECLLNNVAKEKV